jgi:hypothetical protein
MAGSLPRWLQRTKSLYLVLGGLIACAVQGISVYAWTLAAPMIVRVHWRWPGGTPPITVFEYIAALDPWLPVTAATAMAARLGLALAARGKLDQEAVSGARLHMTVMDRQRASGPMSAVLKALGGALLTTVLISGLIDTLTRAVWVFGIVAAMFIARNVFLPKMQPWSWWAELVNRVPLVVRWVATILVSYGVSRSILSISSLSPRVNPVPGAFGAEIFCFLLSLMVGIALLPPIPSTGVSHLSNGTRRTGKLAVLLLILLFATQPVYAGICLDPFCCFNGAAKIAALVVAAILLLALGWYLVSLLGLFEAAFSIEEIEAAIASSRRLQGMISAGMRAIEKKFGHAGAAGFISAFDGILISQESAEALIEQIMSNPAEIQFLNKYIDIYNAMGQGVRLNTFYEFVGFLEGILK